MHPCSEAAATGREENTARPRLLDVFRVHGPAYLACHNLPPQADRLLYDLITCKTARLGGHLQVCPHCGHEQPHYNACRNRACPSCQSLEAARWIEARERRILPVGHHHVVFTLPSQLRPLARCNQKRIYDLLFEAAHATLSELAEAVWGARLGITAVLHTWTRELHYHPHIHCVVTGGGLTLDGTRWVEHTRYLFPGRRMKALFRARLLAGLARLRAAGELLLPEETKDRRDDRDWKALLNSLPDKKQWVVYVKAPFGRSTHVLRYLGRYTHRVALSDQRLVAFDDHRVTFRTHGDDTITLPPDEFIRRFLLHVLPRRFHKIRHFGLYAPAAANGSLTKARDLLGHGDRDEALVPALASDARETWDALLLRLTGKDPLLCPKCQSARMEQRPLPRGPPRKPP